MSILDLVPYRRLIIRPAIAPAPGGHSLSTRAKVRFASGRAYWLFRMKRGYLLLQDAAYVNAYGPFIRVRPQGRVGETFDVVFFTPAPILLLAICTPFVISDLLRHEWKLAAAGTLLMGIKMLPSVDGLSSCAKRQESHLSDTNSRLLTDVNHGSNSRSRPEDRQPAKCGVGDSSADISPDTLEIDSIIQMTVEAAISEPQEPAGAVARRCNRNRSGWSLPGAAHGREMASRQTVCYVEARTAD